MQHLRRRLPFLLIFALCFFSAFFLPAARHAQAASSGEERDLPILMYHSLLKSAKSTYILSPSAFERDLICLKEAGYESVLPAELVAFAEGAGTLPEKPILLTFDDGFYNNYYYAGPLLKKHGFRAVINIVGSYTERFSGSDDHSNPSYAHLTWEELKSAQESGLFEIGNHSYDLHRTTPRYGVMKKKGESEEAYRQALTEDIQKLQNAFQKNCGFTPVTFAYPFGKHCAESQKILKEMGFHVILTSYEGVNRIVKDDPSCLLRLKRFNRAPEYSQAALLKKIAGKNK